MATKIAQLLKKKGQTEESVVETPEQTWQEKSKQLAEEDERFRRFWYVDPDDPESRGGKMGRMSPELEHSEMACAFYYVWRISKVQGDAYPRSGLKEMLEVYNEGVEHCGAGAIQIAWDEYNSEGDGPAGWASGYLPARKRDVS